MFVGRTQIMNIIKRKSELLDDFKKNNMPGSRKRQRRATGNEDNAKFVDE
jgi:hypothetical protein